MAKALQEAKINTSWIQPNEEWDAAMHDFVARILDSSPRNKFLPIFLPVAKEIARLGAINSLTQTLLKLTSPGVPDIYQGTEIWDYSLVDPDNRRPVDYERAPPNAEIAVERDSARTDADVAGWPDQTVSDEARPATFVANTRIFSSAANIYRFTRAERLRNRCVSFVRRLDDKWIAVIAPRLSSRVGFPPIGEAWQDTAIRIARNLSLKDAHDLFTCQPIRHHERQVSCA